MKALLHILLRTVLVLVALWLLFVSVGMGQVAYDLNEWRVSPEREAAKPEAVRFSEVGTVIGGHRGPTAMWMTVGGKSVPIEPTWGQVVTHGLISLLALAASACLLWLAFRKREANAIAGARTNRGGGGLRRNQKDEARD